MRFLLGRTVTVSFIFKEKAEPGAHQQQAGEQQHIHRLAAEALHHPQKHSFAEQSKRALPLPTMQYAHQAGGKNRDRYKVESSMLLRTRDDKQGLGAAGAPPQQKRITHSSRKLQQHARLAWRGVRPSTPEQRARPRAPPGTASKRRSRPGEARRLPDSGLPSCAPCWRPTPYALRRGRRPIPALLAPVVRSTKPGQAPGPSWTDRPSGRPEDMHTTRTNEGENVNSLTIETHAWRRKGSILPPRRSLFRESNYKEGRYGQQRGVEYLSTSESGTLLASGRYTNESIIARHLGVKHGAAAPSRELLRCSCSTWAVVHLK